VYSTTLMRGVSGPSYPFFSLVPAAFRAATVLGISATTAIHVQSLNKLPISQSVNESVDVAIDRALPQRPDLMQQVAGVR
jgi:hypothetical protein